jgi:hypothetical protein
MLMLARYFNVSTDFLLGMTENRKKADETAVLSADEHEHIKLFRALDSHGKKLVECIVKIECERVGRPNGR